MEGYELGKDIHDIKTRLAKIESALGLADSVDCQKRKYKEVEFKSDPNLTQTKSNGEPKIFMTGRTDSGECECREQTLTVYPDGRWEYFAVHHNHSSRFDNGDNHQLRVYIRAGAEIVEYIDGDIWVPTREDRTNKKSGSSKNVESRFADITGFDGTFRCAM